MDVILLLIPLIPLFSATMLIFLHLKQRHAMCLGVGSVGITAALSLVLNGMLWQQPDFVVQAELGQWINIDQLQIQFGLYLDPLSLVMITIVTGVGFLIHCYSSAFMAEDPDFRRFFAYLNLFVSAMLFLVLADNLLLLYLGWEGVGLCSYLLIGFWHQERKNNLAANKAFVMTRIGDTGMAIGLFLIFYQLGTLNIQQIQHQASHIWQTGDSMATLCCLLLFAGAIGKSAQFPLQNWLPDAMAGPTPVSALIHAATMVTAGIYLVARNYGVFQMSPDALYIIALTGTITLLLGASAAMVQSDLKRILAYSTISQLGYMFLALGVGAVSSAVFHLMTHAFFKALLFLSAGALIYVLHHEHNIFRMGGLYKKIPLLTASFAVGCAALASLPLTSGFFSKELILENVIHAGYSELWWAAVLGAFITALYSTRLFLVAFFGPLRQSVSKPVPYIMQIVLCLLILLAIFGGIEPEGLQIMYPSELSSPAEHASDFYFVLPIMTPLVAVLLGAILFKNNVFGGKELNSGMMKKVHSLLKAGWGFDGLYYALFIRPFNWICSLNKKDGIDLLYRRIEWATALSHHFLSRFQTGQLRAYSASLIFFCTLALGWVLLQ